MKNNRLVAMALSAAMTLTSLSPIAVQAATAAQQQPVTTATPLPAKPDITQLESFSELFANAKKFIDNPKTWDKIPAKVVLCVFSPGGANGEGFDFVLENIKELPKYTQIAKNMGLDLKITMKTPLDMHIDFASAKLKRKASTDVSFRIYTNERVATEDFKAGQCDGVAISNLRARAFNQFVGSLDSIGSIESYEQMSEAIRLLSKPAASKYMVNKDFEIVALVPLGAAYIMVNDRKINSLAKAAGKKIAVMDFDKSQAKMVQQIGAQPVAVDLTSIAGKFNNGQVDIIAGPALIFQPLELYRGMTEPNGNVRGAIIRFPVVHVTGVMMMHRGKFPDGIGQLMREFAATQTPLAYQFVDKIEKAIDEKYWIDVQEADKPGYQKLMRESRIAMTKEGYYDKNMMGFLKKIRCRFNPASYECRMNDE